MKQLGRVCIAVALAASAGISWAPTANADVDYGDCYADNGAPYPATDGAGNPQVAIPVPPCVPVGATPAVSTDQDLSTAVDPLTAATYDFSNLPEIVPNVGASPAGVSGPGVPTIVGQIGGLGGNVCDPQYTYKVTKRYADSVTIAWEQTDYNQGPNIADFDFQSGNEVTKSFAFSASFTVEEGVIFAGVKETYGINVQHSETASYGNVAHARNVKAGWSATGKYGVYRAVTDGDYSYLDRNCVVHDYGNARAYSPYHAGWVVYETPPAH